MPDLFLEFVTNGVNKRPAATEDRCWRKAAVAYANGLNQARGGGAWPLTVGSRDINASVACANIGAFVPAAFIPAEKAAVASVTIVT